MDIVHGSRVVGLLVVIGAMLGLVATSHAQTEAKPESGISAVVTVPPLKGLVEPLLPKGSQLTMLMQPGRSEHGYEFTPADTARVAQADLVVYVGLNLETKFDEMLRRPSAAQRRVLCFGEVAGLQKPGEPTPNSAHVHDHAPGEPCLHDDEAGYVDQHLWLDPILVARLIPAVRAEIEAILAARGTLDDAERARLAAAEKDLTERVLKVHSDWATRLLPIKGVPIVTHHNAFPRTAERYGFKIAAVIRPFETSDPSPQEIAATVETIRSQKVPAIFVEPQFNAGAARRIAQAAGVSVGQLDPLGSGDWFGMMEGNLAQLVEHLTATPKPSAEGR
jgi:ABC-type Zn uptake system ZnuABC Zn-binding protein ZnuA